MNVEQYVLEIQESLKQQNYCGRKINYAEMQELHQTYGSLLPEKEFALYVLEIGINSYNGLKNGKYKTAILQKQLAKFMEENASEIKEKLLSQGYAGKLVDYAELQKLHKTYAVKIPENTFAKDILGILSYSYYELKAGRRKVYILRDLQKDSNEDIENIREKLRIDGYVGRKISYLELQDLHIIYGKEFTESRFAQIVLEIPESSYLSAKNHNTNMIVLQRLIGKTVENEIEDIKKTLKEQGYVGKAIDYVELQILHQTYGKQMLEREFAQRVLEITYAYYNTLRNNEKKRAIILKSLQQPKIPREEIDKIKEQIKQQGYEDVIINYKELQKLHQTYGNQMTEKEFATQVLEMTSDNYNRMKRENGKGRIIKKEVIQLSVEQIKSIKSDLHKRGYAGKLIDYAELQKLHQTYGSQIEEKIFAQIILEISSGHYNHMKYDGNNAIILKSLITQVLPEDIERIKQELITQGYEEKSIDYKELQKLHQMYGNQMTESRFAQDVLEMNYTTYIGLKNTTTRMSKILRKAKKANISKEEIERIRAELQELGYIGKAISYSELQNLHKTYAIDISEAEFAQEVLELTYSQYHSVKDGKWNAIILKSLVVIVTNEEVESIKEKLKLQGYENRFIDYPKIQELYQTYGKQMQEREFAQRVLEISDAHYGEVKAGRRKKARILRANTSEVKKEEKIQQFNLSFQELKDSKKIEDIKKRLIDDGYAGKVVDYQEIQRLHKVYGNQIEEKNFAELILGLTYGQYMNVKNTGKVVILKSESEVAEQEYIEKTKEKLEKQGYVGKSINYEQLQMLYQMYGNTMTESKFARKVLEIVDSQYRRMKKGTRNSIILKSLIKQVTQEEIDRIKQELEMQGYSEKKINYTEIQELYRQYGDQMPEYKFAEKVLGISSVLLGNMRRLPKARAKILKEVIIPISEEEINVIKEVLEDKGYGGKVIEYGELQSLHQTYGNQMKENTFAQVVLEISATYYKKLKEMGRSTKILCHSRKVELVRGMLFKESRWYSKEEIEQICKENGMSLDKVIRNIASNGTNLYNKDYKRALNEKGRLWIGKVRMSNEFIERNLKLIMEKAKTALKSAKYRYGIRYNIEDEDMMQNAILWLMENAGSIEKNFSDYPVMLERSIFNKLRRQIVIGILSTLRIKAKTTSLNRKLTPKKKADKAKEGDELGSRIASDYNLEEDVIAREKQNKKRKPTDEDDLAVRCINEMKRQIEDGLGKQEILENMVKQFSLSTEELLKLMQNYLINKGTVTLERGRARWTEER